MGGGGYLCSKSKQQIAPKIDICNIEVLFLQNQHMIGD